MSAKIPKKIRYRDELSVGQENVGMDNVTQCSIEICSDGIGFRTAELMG